MKTTVYPTLNARQKSFFQVWALTLVLLAGCVSTNNQIWNSRVGSYGVKEALRELGEPQKTTRMDDGTQVGEWLTHLGTRSSLYYQLGPTYSARVFDYSVLPRDAPQIPDQYLRLLFAPDGKLVAWDRKYK
jgi:hypothetical protein